MEAPLARSPLAVDSRRLRDRDRRQAQLTISGQASALKQFDLAGVSAGVTLGSARNVGFSLLGKNGVVGLVLFKLSGFGLSGHSMLFEGGHDIDFEAAVASRIPAFVRDRLSRRPTVSCRDPQAWEGRFQCRATSGSLSSRRRWSSGPYRP